MLGYIRAAIFNILELMAPINAVRIYMTARAPDFNFGGTVV
ncbi:hypothetical protein D8I24_4842 [Cupriavidus necator H850]|jgi:hypothetical protein|nr:hypothetical protein D8I24_4842 [Cupriavidus necator H850]